MKYILKRTSCFDDLDSKVIKGISDAKLETLIWHWVEIKKELPWREKNIPVREEQKEAYTIDINSLEELHKLIEECNSDIIIFPVNKSFSGFWLPVIEIYDSWRE